MRILFLLCLILSLSHCSYFSKKTEIDASLYNVPADDFALRANARAQPHEGIVVVDKPFAAAAAETVLQKGGNAADAAAALSFILSVVAPQSTGIGGGGFLLYFDAKTGAVSTFDFRETAPRKASQEVFLKAPRLSIHSVATQDGARAAAVPGLVDGVLKFHQRFGLLSREHVLAPSVDIAEKGFPIYPHLAKAIDERKGIWMHFPASRTLLMAHGKPLGVGDQLVQKDLAKTLRLIQRDGADTFYKGPIAKAIVKEMGRTQGLITLEDLSEYKTVERPALRSVVGDSELVSMGLPSSGGVLLAHMFQMVNHLNLEKTKPLTEQSIHLLTEVMRRAFFLRSVELGDPEFASIPVDHLISSELGATGAATIDPEKASTSKGLPMYWKQGAQRMHDREPRLLEAENTTNFIVIDSQGNAVVSTQSVNTYFGNALVVPGTGMFLNNTMDDFVLDPKLPNAFGLVGGERNSIKPLKRPLSSMTPTFVIQDGKLVMALGAPGGSHIISSVFHVLVARLIYDMSLKEAVNLKRFHHQFMPDHIRFDRNAFSDKVRKSLEARGHVLNDKSTAAYVSAVEILSDGSRVGVADPKSSGEVLAIPLQSK